MAWGRNFFRKRLDVFSNKARKATNRLLSHSEPQDVQQEYVPSGKEIGESLLEEPLTHASFVFPVTRFWLIGAFTVVILYFMSVTFSLLTLILAAYIISVAIEGPIRFFRRIGVGRGRGMFLCYGGLAVLILAIMMVIPFVVIQLGELVSLLVNVFQQVQGSIETLGWEGFVSSRTFLPGSIKDGLIENFRDPEFVQSIQNQLNTLIGTWESWLGNLTSFARKVTSGFAQTLRQISLVVVLSIFFSIEKEGVLALVVKTFSSSKSDVALVHERVVRVYSKLQLWLKGQLFLMIYVGLLAYVGFWIMHALGVDIEKKELLALMAGVTEIVPYLGPILGAVPALLVATLSHGVWGFISVSVLFAIIQWTENNIVVPVVMNKVLGISALLTFVCILLGGWIFGFVGVLLSVPIAVITAVISDKDFGKDHDGV